MDERTFTLLYKSMVRPHVEFANSVWCPYKIGDSKEIEKIQKRATKLVIKLKNKSYTDRLIRYDTRCYFNVRSKADISQLNLPKPAYSKIQTLAR